MKRVSGIDAINRPEGILLYSQTAQNTVSLVVLSLKFQGEVSPWQSILRCALPDVTFIIYTKFQVLGARERDLARCLLICSLCS